MGLDLRATRAPMDSAPLGRIRDDPEAFASAAVFPPFTDSDWGEPLPAVSVELCAVMPCVTGWEYVYPDRTYRAASWLLGREGVVAAWSEGERESDLPDRLLVGEEPFAAHATSGQGIPWRCSSVPFLLTAAEAIETIDLAAARRAFSVPRMVDDQVYKVFEGEDEDELFTRVLDNLVGLSRYYRRAVDSGLDLLVEIW